MNCDEFLTRMHECIDDRLPLDSDRKLQEHVVRCVSCRVQWTTWSQIASLVSARTDDASGQAASGQACARLAPVQSKSKNVSCAAVGLAVAALIMVTFVAKHSEPNKPEGESPLLPSSAVTGITSMVQPDSNFSEPVDSPANAALWWQEMQDRDWVAQTMPAVRTVRDGVAPLGRSILQAVSILTIGGGERTS